MEERRSKVLALFQAVVELLNEGADINTIKVSDITERAGIGKGTAYIYFKSREEILASALVYEIETKIQAELICLKAFEDFANKIRYIFDRMICQNKEQRELTYYLNLLNQISEMKTDLAKEFQKKKSKYCDPFYIFQEICREGKENGEIRTEIPLDAASIMVQAAMETFAQYLKRREENEKTDVMWMKQFLCEGLLERLL